MLWLVDRTEGDERVAVRGELCPGLAWLATIPRGDTPETHL